MTLREAFAPEFVTEILGYALSTPGPHPPVFGIVGLQGSGKSTLARQLVASGRVRGLSVVAMSIDDFYLRLCERQRLGRIIHPLLATRGPPGTHDVALACATLDALRELRSSGVVRTPRFDKIADQRLSPARWTKVHAPPDLIVLEGWFLKTPPEPGAEPSGPINALEREEDPDGTWRHYCNMALATYAPLWARIGRLLLLQGPGFEMITDWRWQQERSLQANNPHRLTMSRSQVSRFVQFFERVSRHALRTLPEIADRTVQLDARVTAPPKGARRTSSSIEQTFSPSTSCCNTLASTCDGRNCCGSGV